MTTLSLLVPTHSKDRPLARCLDSVAGQLLPGDEVIVIGDTHDGEMPEVEALVRGYGRQFLYLVCNAGLHDWGHSQLNMGLSIASGDYIHCNDDDDVWLPGALDAFREDVALTAEPTPHLYRFLSYLGITFWQERGLFVRDHIGGHCLLAPNVPGKVGRFGAAYNGDFDWLESTVTAFGGPERAIWRETLICRARPS